MEDSDMAARCSEGNAWSQARRSRSRAPQWKPVDKPSLRDDDHSGPMPSLRSLTRTLLLPGPPVSRRTYILCGLTLLVFKYAVEALTLAGTGGGFLTVGQFIDPVLDSHATVFARGAPW